MALFPIIGKVIRAEMAGYDHIRAQFSASDSKRVMEQKIIIFTVIFFLMACEGVWRASHKHDLVVP